MNLSKVFWKLLAAIAISLLWLCATPSALAQTPPSPTSDSAPALQPQTQPSQQSSPRANQTKQTTEAASTPSATPAQARQGKTYKQPPHPYNMDAIEAYDEEIYGAGR